jgi:Rps23 Pro-64 3,4-dihydroxylase Tpa1-like proline 4-hydroxylase
VKSSNLVNGMTKYVQINHFLSPEMLGKLMDYVTGHELEFTPSSTSTGKLGYRQSCVHQPSANFPEDIIATIRSTLPQVLSELGVQPFPIAQVEVQVTAHHENNFYKIHRDNDSLTTASRVITYVYYFFRDPKPFTGGELLIYNTELNGNQTNQSPSFQKIEPYNNSIVFFLSSSLHEVLPVKCSSQAFADSRFTVNGWIRQQLTTPDWGKFKSLMEAKLGIHA